MEGQSPQTPPDGEHATSSVTHIFGLQGPTVTVKSHRPGEPFLVRLSVRIKEPEAPAVTLTEASVVDPLMVPFPLIDQLCVTVPPAGLTVEP